MSDRDNKTTRHQFRDQQMNCHEELTISIISGKWKIDIIYYLEMEGTLRFNEFRKKFPKLSHKVLTQQLRELETDGIVHRKVYTEIPPRVEYSLTPRGQSLLPILRLINEWGHDHLSYYVEKDKQTEQ
ncbi:winged helix-turn-helix transcriptional regulator [Paenibacillus sediminis]|uniref:DNA-binding HxlR family transcriptional regulator n=1 Tax=Paenibacillus sediminis TaxID=664909 RepID=A0ABS4H6J8_9BACL|nr:DNA-binding HxlR family transcriptional regulator [Paenibacillus sediminis]